MKITSLNFIFLVTLVVASLMLFPHRLALPVPHISSLGL